MPEMPDRKSVNEEVLQRMRNKAILGLIESSNSFPMEGYIYDMPNM
jgi:hypothetical protein